MVMPFMEVSRGLLASKLPGSCRAHHTAAGTHHSCASRCKTQLTPQPHNIYAAADCRLRSRRVFCVAAGAWWWCCWSRLWSAAGKTVCSFDGSVVTHTAHAVVLCMVFNNLLMRRAAVAILQASCRVSCLALGAAVFTDACCLLAVGGG